MENTVPIIAIKRVTHDVKQFRVERPAGYQFVAGQATEVSINKPEWKEEKRPFTFTSLATDPFLEFVIKLYSDRDGVTNALDELVVGDELILHEVWGAISYQGKGYFIAGGAGITPFIAVLRQLKKDNELAGNSLYFSNKTTADIILKEELESMPGLQTVFITTQEEGPAYEHHFIDKDFLQRKVADFSKHFYVCGPDKMVSAINQSLIELGAKPDTVVFEK